MLAPRIRRAQPWEGSAKPAPAVKPPKRLAPPDRPFPRPHQELRKAARKGLDEGIEAGVRHVLQNLAGAPDEDLALHLACADALITSRTGNAAWAKLRHANPDQPSMEKAIEPRDPKERDALISIVQRLDAVALHLGNHGRVAGGPPRGAFRPPIGSEYVGIDAESDTPYRPVNVGVTRYEQRDCVLDVPGYAGPLTVRYVQAGAIEPGTHVVLYLHGLGSRAEEMEHVATQLLGLGDYAVIAPDLPGHGCTTRPPVDAKLSLRYATGAPKEGYPYLERMERFVAAFVRHLDIEHEHFAKKRLTVIGGSLGGTLAMRLSMDGSAFQPASVAFWSPAGLWGSFAADPFKRDNITDGVLKRATVGEPEGRDRYFAFNFVEKPWPLTLRNCQRWWSVEYLLHLDNAPIDAAIADRLELYGEGYRRWQMRLAYEQLCFSIHDTRTRRLIGGEDGRTPVLLLCGQEDNDMGATIFDNSVALEKHLREEKRQRGASAWIEGGGHSIHDECPKVVAEELHRFVKEIC